MTVVGIENIPPKIITPPLRLLTQNVKTKSQLQVRLELR